MLTAPHHRAHPARHVTAGLVVIGLHLAGLLAWWTAPRSMQGVPHEARLPSIAVWLPALTDPPINKAQPANQPQRAPATPARALPTADRNATAQPDNPNEVATAISAGSGVPVPAAAPGPAAAPTSPSLNLDLSRKTIASVAPPSLAEQSPFHGRLPATVERQIATAAAETGPWTEERMDNDHIRFRRGNTCVTMQRPQAAIIDPFNEAMARLPWRASKPEECH